MSINAVNFCHNGCTVFAETGRCPVNGLPERCKIFMDAQNEALRDAWPCLRCGDCVFFNVRADMDGVESQCKRLDHKKYRFAVPWFKSYDCGQFTGTVCRDFVPDRVLCPYLASHWTGFDAYYGAISPDDMIALAIDGDQSVRYNVRRIDFVDNTFLDEHGALKWIKKCYYKRSRSSPTGYELITEYNDRSE